MQTKYSINDFISQEFSSSTSYQVLDVFSFSSGEKKTLVKEETQLTYLAVFNNANVDFSFDLIGENARIDFFGVFIGNIDANIVVSLLANKSFARLHLLSLVVDDSDISLDASVFITKNVSMVEGYLQQEQILFGKPKHLSVRPILDVQSNSVKASHGAKIYAIDEKKMFYMMSKGLSFLQAQRIVVESSLQSLFDQLPEIDEEKKQETLNIIYSNLFI